MLGITRRIEEDLITDNKTKGQGRTTWWQPQITREDTMAIAMIATVAITMATITIATTVATAVTIVIATIRATTTEEERQKIEKTCHVTYTQGPDTS